MPAIEAEEAVEELSQLAERLAAAVREAGALALSLFQTPLKNWTKGPTASPVCEADIAVDNLLRERLTPHRRRRRGQGLGFRLAVGGKRRRSEAACRTLCLDRRSDRRHPRLYGGAGGLGGVGGADRGRPADRRLPLRAGRRTTSSWPGRKAGATRNGTAIAATKGAGLKDARIAGPKNLLERLPRWRRRFRSCRGCARWRCGLPASRTESCDVAFAGGNSHDWDLAAADLLVHEAGGALTPFAGGTVIYNRPVPRHGMLVAAGRDRHATLIELLGDKRLAFS